MRSSEAGQREGHPPAQRPLELILARNLLTNLATPGLLVDEDANIVFYNEAAAALLGRSFEDTGRMSAEEWSSAFGPLNGAGGPVDIDRLAIADALRRGRPAHAELRIRTASGQERPIEASAVPIVASDERSSGAMILLWPIESKAADG